MQSKAFSQCFTSKRSASLRSASDCGKLVAAIPTSPELEQLASPEHGFSGSIHGRSAGGATTGPSPAPRSLAAVSQGETFQKRQIVSAPTGRPRCCDR